MKIKNYKAGLCCTLFVLLSVACSKGGSSTPDTGGNNDNKNTAPTNIVINAQRVGVTDSTPDGDGSGMVNVSLSATNATSFQVTLPTENKTYTVQGASGTANCTFASAPGTTSQYAVAVTVYNNTVKKDTAIFVKVYIKPVGQTLLWSDEFDGTSLNTNTWNYEKGNNNGWGNKELQYYTSDAANVSVKDGYLQISAINSPNYNGSGFDYTSARITTQNKYSFKGQLKLNN
jgi:hypothetical protein